MNDLGKVWRVGLYLGSPWTVWAGKEVQAASEMASPESHECARMDEYLVSGNLSVMIPETGHCSSDWIKELVGSYRSSREG